MAYYGWLKSSDSDSYNLLRSTITETVSAKFECLCEKLKIKNPLSKLVLVKKEQYKCFWKLSTNSILKKENNMKVNQDTEFTSNTMIGSGGVLYALANKTTKTDEDGRISYEAEAIAIQNESQAVGVIKQWELDNIITDTKGFYGDGMSRVDLITILVLKLAETIVDTEIVPTKWKTKDGEIDITFGDIKLAAFESISKKGSIVLGAGI